MLIDHGWKHDDLAEDLAAHLRGASDRMVWTDMQLGPSGSPRPDVFTLNKSFRRATPLAYECKISVADFRSDITSGKWQKYLAYAGAVIFAVPAGLIDKSDAPKGCGLMVRGPSAWRTVKGPTLQHVQNLPFDAWMKLLIDGVERHRRYAQPRKASVWRVADDLRDKLGERIARALTDGDRFIFDEAEKERLYREGVKGVDSEIERYRKTLVGNIEAETRRLNDAGAILLDLIGMSIEEPRGNAIYRANKLIARLSENHEIERLRRALRSARRHLDEVDDVEQLTAISERATAMATEAA